MQQQQQQQQIVLPRARSVWAGQAPSAFLVGVRRRALLFTNLLMHPSRPRPQ